MSCGHSVAPIKKKKKKKETKRAQYELDKKHVYHIRKPLNGLLLTKRKEIKTVVSS